MSEEGYKMQHSGYAGYLMHHNLKQPAQDHPFAFVEAKMGPILQQHIKYMTQVILELSHGRT